MTSSAINRVARQFKFTIARRSSVSRYKWFSKLHTIVKIYSVSREFSMLLQTLRRRPRVRLRVPESVRYRFTRNDILIISFFVIPIATCGERLLSCRSRRYFLSRVVLFLDYFFFHIPWNESRSMFTVHLPSAADYVCRMRNAAARSRTAIFSKRFRNQCLESVGYARGMHARNTFVSSRLN